MWMKIIWWNGPQDIKAAESEGSRPPMERQSVSPLIDNQFSIKAIHKSIIDIIDIHNFIMDVYDSIIDIHNSVM